MGKAEDRFETAWDSNGIFLINRLRHRRMVGNVSMPKKGSTAFQKIDQLMWVSMFEGFKVSKVAILANPREPEKIEAVDQALKELVRHLDAAGVKSEQFVNVAVEDIGGYKCRFVSH